MLLPAKSIYKVSSSADLEYQVCPSKICPLIGCRDSSSTSPPPLGAIGGLDSPNWAVTGKVLLVICSNMQFFFKTNIKSLNFHPRCPITLKKFHWGQWETRPLIGEGCGSPATIGTTPDRMEATCTAATYETTAVHDLQADYAIWSIDYYHRGQHSPHSRHNCYTRIHLHGSQHSFLNTGRCRGHKWRTSDRSGS